MKLENLAQQKKYLLIAVVILLLFLVLLFRSEPSQTSSKAIEFIGDERVATINNGDELFEFIGSSRYYNLRFDLYEVGYSQRVPANNMVFNVKKIKNKDKENQKIVIEGEYLNSSVKILLEIYLKQNQRQEHRITNLSNKNDLSFVSLSNSKFNKFIQSLPVVKENYTIEYIIEDENILINLNVRDSSLAEKIINEIKTPIDDDSFDRSKIQIIYPIESFGF